MKKQIFKSGLVFKVYNFHKDNWDEIKELFIIHFAYAACVASIPTAIFLNSSWGVFLAFLCTYSMFSIVVQIKLTTFYGKALRAIACTLGAFLSWYSITHYYILYWVWDFIS